MFAYDPSLVALESLRNEVELPALDEDVERERAKDEYDENELAGSIAGAVVVSNGVVLIDGERGPENDEHDAAHELEERGVARKLVVLGVDERAYDRMDDQVDLVEHVDGLEWRQRTFVHFGGKNGQRRRLIVGVVLLLLLLFQVRVAFLVRLDVVQVDERLPLEYVRLDERVEYVARELVVLAYQRVEEVLLAAESRVAPIGHEQAHVPTTAAAAHTAAVLGSGVGSLDGVAVAAAAMSAQRGLDRRELAHYAADGERSARGKRFDWVVFYFEAKS